MTGQVKLASFKLPLQPFKMRDCQPHVIKEGIKTWDR